MKRKIIVQETFRVPGSTRIIEKGEILNVLKEAVVTQVMRDNLPLLEKILMTNIKGPHYVEDRVYEDKYSFGYKIFIESQETGEKVSAVASVCDAIADGMQGIASNPCFALSDIHYDRTGEGLTPPSLNADSYLSENEFVEALEGLIDYVENLN